MGMQSVPVRVADYGRQRHLSQATLTRWQAWTETDQGALLDVAAALRLGENQLRDLIDWLEEIAVRDGQTMHDILERPPVVQSLGSPGSRNDKLKALKAALRRLRYPRLSLLEENLRGAVRALDLGQRVRVAFPPAMEGDEVTIEIVARNTGELRDSLERLQVRLAGGDWQRVFALLDEV